MTSMGHFFVCLFFFRKDMSDDVAGDIPMSPECSLRESCKVGTSFGEQLWRILTDVLLKLFINFIYRYKVRQTMAFVRLNPCLTLKKYTKEKRRKKRKENVHRDE